jgi:hypothetical protein
MRYRRYYVTPKSDGSVRVVSHGTIIGAYRAILPFLLVLLIVGFLMNLVHGYWQTCGVFVLLIGRFMPNLTKRRGLTAKQ